MSTRQNGVAVENTAIERKSATTKLYEFRMAFNAVWIYMRKTAADENKYLSSRNDVADAPNLNRNRYANRICIPSRETRALALVPVIFRRVIWCEYHDEDRPVTLALKEASAQSCRANSTLCLIAQSLFTLADSALPPPPVRTSEVARCDCNFPLAPRSLTFIATVSDAG